MLPNISSLQELLAKNFPTNGSLVIFLLYMAMFVAQGMLVTVSRSGGSDYPYNTVTVVLITEALKLLLSGSIYMRDNTVVSLGEGILKNKNVLVLYFVPATLYCLYNNLAFVSLSFFNPTTYFMFMQIRLLLTGLIYQVLFSQILTCKQWGSLLLLTIGCLIHAGGTTKESQASFALDSWQAIGLGLLFILTQVLCSVFAGVYNEFLIKGKGADIDIMIQNVFMYLDSIICNVLLLGGKGELSSAFTIGALSSLANPLVLLLIINNAVLGIITSLFLQKLNSVVKAFASALELVITALVSWPLLDIPLTPHTVTALVAICAAVVIYAQNPVVNPVRKKPSELVKIVDQ